MIRQRLPALIAELRSSAKWNGFNVTQGPHNGRNDSETSRRPEETLFWSRLVTFALMVSGLLTHRLPSFSLGEGFGKLRTSADSDKVTYTCGRSRDLSFELQEPLDGCHGHGGADKVHEGP